MPGSVTRSMLPGTHILRWLLRQRSRPALPPGTGIPRAVMRERLEAVMKYDKAVEEWFAAEWARLTQGGTIPRPAPPILIDALLTAFDARFTVAGQTETERTALFILLCVHFRKLRRGN